MTGPLVVPSRAELAHARAAMTGRVAVVMTMGALHDGHAALVRAARAAADHVLATIFVNPLQFGAGEDLDRYPRTLEADLALLGAEGTDAVFVPTVAEMYPPGQAGTRVEPGLAGGGARGCPPARPLRRRPDGGAEAAAPHPARRRVLRREGLPAAHADPADGRRPRPGYRASSVCRPCGNPTAWRCPAATGTSPPAERRSALALSARAAGRCGRGRRRRRGRRRPRRTLARSCTNAGGIETDYLELTDVDLGPAPRRGEARLLVAARVGSTRLIDNTTVLLEPR